MTSLLKYIKSSALKCLTTRLTVRQMYSYQTKRFYNDIISDNNVNHKPIERIVINGKQYERGMSYGLQVKDKLSVDCYLINAFTNRSFSGNPAFICLMDYIDEISDENKQRIASEVNQPITVFLARQWTRSGDESEERYKIEYFLPKEEVDLCGHATIASVMLLKTVNEQNINGVMNDKKYLFETKCGEVLTTAIDDNQWITISLPIISPLKAMDLSDKWTEELIANTLGHELDINDVTEVSSAEDYIIIRLNDCNENLVTKVTPDFDAINGMDERNERKGGIIVTQKANKSAENVDFNSRVFMPWIGVNEDHVCGTAHTQLTAFWSQRLAYSSGQTLKGRQCSQRSAVVHCCMNGDRVELSGTAVIVMEGKYCFVKQNIFN